ncbi:MAG: flagellar basal body P-ring protein FlgI, partial [Burkholderiaceae bacterium]
APFTQGQTVAADRADIAIEQDGGALMLMSGAAQLADVVKALNVLGANSQDLISILQALKAAGSLKGELEII